MQPPLENGINEPCYKSPFGTAEASAHLDCLPAQPPTASAGPPRCHLLHP